MANVDNHDNQAIIVNRIDDAIVTHANAIVLFPVSLTDPGGRGFSASAAMRSAMRRLTPAGSLAIARSADGVMKTR